MSIGRLAHSYPIGGGAGHVTNHDHFHHRLELRAWSDSGTWQWCNCQGRRRWRCSGIRGIDSGLALLPSPELGAGKVAGTRWHLEADACKGNAVSGRA